MFGKLVIIALATARLCWGAPTETEAALSSVKLENSLLEYQLAYQSISDHVVFVVPNGPKGLAHATLAIYQETVDKASPLPAKKGKPFSKAVQLALCTTETNGILQVLKAHALLREYAEQFTAAQRQKMIGIIKKDKKVQEAYAPAFAKYTPLCADSIAHNGRITVETMNVTLQVYKAA